MNIERKWMVLRLDTDGVTIVYSNEEKDLAVVEAIKLSKRDYSKCGYSIKYGYPWEA